MVLVNNYCYNPFQPNLAFALHTPPKNPLFSTAVNKEQIITKKGESILIPTCNYLYIKIQ